MAKVRHPVVQPTQDRVPPRLLPKHPSPPLCFHPEKVADSPDVHQKHSLWTPSQALWKEPRDLWPEMPKPLPHHPTKVLTLLGTAPAPPNFAPLHTALALDAGTTFSSCFSYPWTYFPGVYLEPPPIK